MKDTIIFCLNVDSEESYGEIANFIYKWEYGKAILNEEISRVSYNYYPKSGMNLPKDWVKRITSDINKFKKVENPGNIRNITSQAEVIYCICISKESDIINLNNLYLIKKHYSDLNILALFLDCDDSRYFSISQFLYSIATKDDKFYNECYFQYRNNLQRSQINNISFSTSFTPLQVIDTDNVKRLFQVCKELVTVDYLDLMLSKKAETFNEYDDLLDGATKILRNKKELPILLSDNQYIKVLQGIDVLAYVLLCYVICQDKMKFTPVLLGKYAVQMQQYSNAIRQLAENIVFHSKTGQGVIAFRLHDKKSSYISDKYKIENVQNSYLEIIVSDFCRDNSFGNISHNFISNLKDDRLKNVFRELQPKSFFEHDYNETIRSAWGDFYRNPDNIGKHFGLRIFQSVVSKFGGMFGAESHCDYINNPGDSYLSYHGNESIACMPGTRYHIVFPIENVQNVIGKQDISLDSGINIDKRIKDYLGYTTGDVILDNQLEMSQSQQQKNEQIKEMADYIGEKLKKTDKNIIYISLADIEDNMGEIIAKSLVIALFQFEQNAIVVFYQCTDNLKKNIFDTMSIFYNNTDIEGMFFEKKIQIVIYSQDFEEVVLDLSSAVNTDNINAYIAHMKCIAAVEGYLNQDTDKIDLDKGALSYIPCDVLHKVDIDGKSQTLFEHYTECVLKNNIQKSEFGCQLEHTHMRLGSTIHINRFYEAEILFGNKLFVSRFALLLVKDMQRDLDAISKLTLYGYGTYSESVLVQMIEMINCLYPENEKDIDYIILEREEERRGFLHKDRIRYNQAFMSPKERIVYFKDRKIAIVVLINSTLKTHKRLISLFEEENNVDKAECQWLIRNYAVILVGNNNTNAYWKLAENNTVSSAENIIPLPQYFIQVDADYQEPLGCNQCFPDNPMSEVPLVEVNAASTIPNQAFGLFNHNPAENFVLNYKVIQKEEDYLVCLKNEFIYGHVQRSENHFLYYFKTENICTKQKEEIRKTLRKWKLKLKERNELQYNIIVSPMHFSNAGFVELVNSVVFEGNAILLRIDFDKEYRCNAYTKYSYLRNYIEQLNSVSPNGSIHVHFVDDAIISGRTFHRAKTLMKSILDLGGRESNFIEVTIFDKVFVLVDRNSYESRNQYVNNVLTDFYAFRTINISSLRNYGDSCVYCNLKKEADLLFDTASTKSIADYWRHCAEKFQLYPLEQCTKEYEQQDYEKQFRRLFCTHMAQYVLRENHHGNDKVKALYLILNLINKDYESRREEHYEYFLSYLKCISRPFLVFNRAVKEAIFDILLLLIDSIVCGKKINNAIKEIELDKPYLTERKIKIQFNKLDRNILQAEDRSEKDREDLVKLLMKQLTELKSNYIIRPEKMDALFAFMADKDMEQFEKYYMTLIDRLVGASSDTNKSVWLDDRIINHHFLNVPLDFRAWVLLENTRAFRDGIEKLYDRVWGKSRPIEKSKQYEKVINKRIVKIEEQYDYRRAYHVFGEFERKYKDELNKYHNTNDLDLEEIHITKKRIKRFLRSLPKLKTISIDGIIKSMKASKNNWIEIFDYIGKQLKEDLDTIVMNQQTNQEQSGVLGWINAESDMYQFSNFYQLLKKEEYIQGSKLSENGADMIACCVKVLQLCRSKDQAILDKVKQLTTLLKVILRAKKVQIIVENKADINLDEWKLNIEKRYNKIIDQIEISGENAKPERINIKDKKHYLVIMEKAGDEDTNTEVSIVTEELIEILETQSSELFNFIIDSEHGAVIWKLENNQRSIWINIENPDWQSDKVEHKLRIARDVRKIMMFYQELQREIFNPEADDYINDISHARKTLNIYNSNKVLNHTKDFSREMLFEQARWFFQKDDNERYVKNYPSYVLKLLADIVISQYYRYGLKGNSYQDDRGINSAAKWEDFATLICDGQKIDYCIGKTETITLQLNVTGIDSNNEILCRKGTSSIWELNMLLLALILNAAEQNRGKRQSVNSDIQQEPKYVILNIYKKEGYLVIENECENLVDVYEIKRKLHHIPDSEDDGISLWSFNYYIKQCINSLILARLKEIEGNAQNQPYTAMADEIEDVGRWIIQLTGSDYEIQLDSNEQSDGKIYFKVGLPIFMEKFRKNEERR